MDIGIRAILSGFNEARQQFADLNKEMDKTESSAGKLNVTGGKTSDALGGLGGEAANAAGGFSLLEKGVTLAAGAIGTVFVAAAVYASKQLLEGINNVRTLGEEFHNMSQKTGIAAETLGSYQLAAQTNNISMQQFSQGLVQFNRHISDATKGTGEAADAFARAGVSLKDENGVLKNTDELLREVADAFAGMKDGAGKTALAVALFSRAGADMIPLLNEGAAGLAKLQEEARKAGIVLDKETAEAASKFNANLAVLKAYGQGFWMEIASPIVEGLAKITTAMRDARREGEGFWGTLFAGAGKLGQIATGTDSTEAELAGTNSKLQRLYQERGRVQNSQFPDQGQLISIDQQINSLEQDRNRLADVLAINNPVNVYSEVPSTVGGKREAPTKEAKAAKETKEARGPSIETTANAEARAAHDAVRAGEMTREEYVAYLDGLAESYGDYENLRVHFAAMAAEERGKIQTEESRRILVGQKAQEAVDKEARDKEDRDFLLSMHTQRQIREQAVERDVTLTHEQKAERLQAIRDELDMWTSLYPQVKKDVVELDKRIAAQRMATEVEYQQKVKAILGNPSFDSLAVVRGVGTNLQKVFEDMLHGHFNFERAMEKIWKGIVDDTISEMARLGKNAVIEVITGPLKDAFKEIFTSVKGWVVENLFSPIKELFSSVFDSIKSFFSDLFSDLFGEVALDTSAVALDGSATALTGAAEALIAAAGALEGAAATQGAGGLAGGGLAGGGLLAGGGAVGAEELGIGFAAGGGAEVGGGLLIGESAVGAGVGGGAAAAGGAGGMSAASATGIGALVLLGINDIFGEGGFIDDPGQLTSEMARGAMPKSGQQMNQNIADLFGVDDSVADFFSDPVGSILGGESIKFVDVLHKVKDHFAEIFGVNLGPGVGETNSGIPAPGISNPFAMLGFASGTDMTVTKPTLFMAGESGAERVMVNPLSGAARNNFGEKTGFVNNGIMIADEYTMRRFKKQLGIA